jgi:hypothetical protein
MYSWMNSNVLLLCYPTLLEKQWQDEKQSLTSTKSTVEYWRICDISHVLRVTRSSLQREGGRPSVYELSQHWVANTTVVISGQDLFYSSKAWPYIIHGRSHIYPEPQDPPPIRKGWLFAIWRPPPVLRFYPNSTLLFFFIMFSWYTYTSAVRLWGVSQYSHMPRTVY